MGQTIMHPFSTIKINNWKAHVDINTRTPEPHPSSTSAPFFALSIILEPLLNFCPVYFFLLYLTSSWSSPRNRGVRYQEWYCQGDLDTSNLPPWWIRALPLQFDHQPEVTCHECTEGRWDELWEDDNWIVPCDHIQRRGRDYSQCRRRLPVAEEWE